MLNPIDNECFKIMPADALIERMSKYNINIISDAHYSLRNRYAKGYLLPTGEVIVLSEINHPSINGILYQNKDCYQADFKKDYFPIENPLKTLYEYDQSGIKVVNISISNYQKYLNQKYGTNYTIINNEVIRDYLKKYILSENYNDDPFENISITCVYAEYQRIKFNAKWAIVEKMGIYNPFFEPELVTTDNKIFAIKIPEKSSISDVGTEIDDFMFSLNLSYKDFNGAIPLSVLDSLKIPYKVL
jgi:hypothetical protein